MEMSAEWLASLDARSAPRPRTLLAREIRYADVCDMVR